MWCKSRSSQSRVELPDNQRVALAQGLQARGEFGAILTLAGVLVGVDLRQRHTQLDDGVAREVEALCAVRRGSSDPFEGDSTVRRNPPCAIDVCAIGVYLCPRDNSQETRQ